MNNNDLQAQRCIVSLYSVMLKKCYKKRGTLNEPIAVVRDVTRNLHEQERKLALLEERYAKLRSKR